MLSRLISPRHPVKKPACAGGTSRLGRDLSVLVRYLITNR